LDFDSPLAVRIGGDAGIGPKKSQIPFKRLSFSFVEIK
jgi:hypothetical protein